MPFWEDLGLLEEINGGEFYHFEGGDKRITVYDENFSRLRQFTIPASERLLRIFLDDGDVSLNFNLSQTLWNSDAMLEYAVAKTEISKYDSVEPEYTPYGDVDKEYIYHAKYLGFDIKSESGSILSSFRFPNGGYDFYSQSEDITSQYDLDWLNLFTIGNKTYFYVRYYTQDRVYFDENRRISYDNQKEYYDVYSINTQTQSIALVKSEMPVQVRPTVASQGQDITIELGESSQASEVRLVNSLGQTVRTIPIQDGQREVKVNTSDLNKGVHLINTRSRNNQHTSKIVVR